MTSEPESISACCPRRLHPTISQPIDVEERMAIQFRPGMLSGYAAPLMPLHRRDRIILTGWFDRGDMGDIHADITYHLDKLVPEPCWDDSIYEFLHDYL